MWARRLRWTGPGGLGAEELRVRRREREAALRKARREQHLVSKRLLREETEAEDGAGMVPEPLSEAEVLELLRGMQRGSEERKRSLKQLHRALRNKETQQKFVRLDGSIRTLLGVFTSPLADIQMEAAHCLHELSHSSDPAVAEACLPATPYLLTYLSGHSVEFMELCLYTLGNLVVESEAVRKQLLPQGIIPVLASCIQSPHQAVLEALGYALSQLLQAKEAPTEIIPLVLDSPLPQHMLQLVCSGLKTGTGAAVEFAWCLHYIISTRPPGHCCPWGPCLPSPPSCSTWLLKSPQTLLRAWSCWCARCCGVSAICWQSRGSAVRTRFWTSACSSPSSSSCRASSSTIPSWPRNVSACSTTSRPGSEQSFSSPCGTILVVSSELTPPAPHPCVEGCRTISAGGLPWRSFQDLPEEL
ncbi:transmembrane and coiled-coil domain-containing protein 6 isoform X4 [Heliangelus exortis]|uniref:transmembrane and coiled-coil domain-containing protein 6 isoform X4 n=1 Tax=Heliangelus exortis TaxID=472823 RepID=UPI003A8D35A8